ncbi:MAG TPA: DnaJ domain-containing protein [Kofleriaceae bacterium]|nr:DnaJ domain-containing protein [Kofleriaceae bacterium]
MSVVPPEIAGIGSTQQRLRVSPGFDPLKAAVGPEEYFVLSRIDGSQTLRDVLLTTGLPVDRAIAIVTRLRSIGALLLPGETSAPPPASVPAPPPSATPPIQPTIPSVLPSPRPLTQTGAPPTMPLRRAAVGSTRVATSPEPMLKDVRPSPSKPPPVDDGPHHDLTLPAPSADELHALTERVELSDGERRRILAIMRLADGRDPRALLGVSGDADARAIKRAYFLLSKEIHPDRYYGKQLGSFAHRMSVAFEAVSRAYARLTTGERGARGSSSHAAVHSDQPQTPQAYAAELFERACALEVTGDALEAMKMFAAAVRVDAQLRYLRRATSCALAAGQPKTAVEYAKKVHAIAPTDPSSARLLAGAFRAAGKLVDAEEILVMAMALKSENDALTSELRNDLAEVRRLLAQT